MTTDLITLDVPLTEAAVPLADNFCRAFGTFRKDFLTRLAANCEHLAVGTFPLEPAGPVKVQKVQVPAPLVAEVQAKFDTYRSHALGNLFSQVLLMPQINGYLLDPGQDTLNGVVAETLRWFQFGAITGTDLLTAMAVRHSRILQYEALPDAPGHLCYGYFENPLVPPGRFGFRGKVQDGELQFTFVLPL